MALALLGSSVFAAVAAAAASPDDIFAAWCHVHNKVYLTSAEEAAARRNFAVNDALVAEHNSKGKSFALGHNLYSDPMMTQRTVAFARHAVRAVADFAGTIYAVSLGNEMNNVDTNPASGCTVPQILAWTDAIVSAIHAELPGLCGLMGGWWRW